MSFLHPAVLWALPAAVIPLVIHLLRRRKLPKKDFAAMHFLSKALQKSRRRILLEDVVLLSLRIGAVLFLVLALAKPSLDVEQTAYARGAQAEIIVLDASMSMGFRDQNGIRTWDLALAEAAQRLENRLESNGDLAVVIRAGYRNTRLVSGAPETALQILDEIDDPDPTVCAMGEALLFAAKEAETIARPSLPVRITVLTDLQRETWDLQGAETSALLRVQKLFPQLDVVKIGTSSKPNLAVTHLGMNGAHPTPGEPVEIETRVRNFSTSTRTARLELTLDAELLATKDVELEPGAEGIWREMVTPAAIGMRELRVRIKPDGLSQDDTRAAILPVRDVPTVILSGTPHLPGEKRGAYESLEGFLDLGVNAPLDIRQIPPSAVDSEALDTASVLVLADPHYLDADSISIIVRRVREGMGLLWAVGPQTNTGIATALLSALGTSPEILGPMASPNTTETLAIQNPAHSALNFFVDPTWRALLEEIPFSAFRELNSSLAPPGARVPLTFSGGHAAWVEWKEEEGHCALLAAVPIPGWNKMEEIPGGTLPFLMEVVNSMVTEIPHPIEVEAGKDINVILAAGQGGIYVDPPKGPRRNPVRVTARAEGGREIIAASPALTTGIWKIAGNATADIESPLPHSTSVALVPAQTESNLAAWSTEALIAAAPDLSVRSEPTERQDESRTGFPIGNSIFLLVAGLLASESLLAAWLDRKRAVI
ncbi:MAG TPA: hypothetical protein DDW23_00945 [Planctomycetes bacterium]|nr:hypothetical protein [Planctomycetota bacterium]